VKIDWRDVDSLIPYARTWPTTAPCSKPRNSSLATSFGDEKPRKKTTKTVNLTFRTHPTLVRGLGVLADTASPLV
jgi:hypothetical protein